MQNEQMFRATVVVVGTVAVILGGWKALRQRLAEAERRGYAAGYVHGIDHADPHMEGARGGRPLRRVK